MKVCTQRPVLFCSISTGCLLLCFTFSCLSDSIVLAVVFHYLHLTLNAKHLRKAVSYYGVQCVHKRKGNSLLLDSSNNI